MNRIKLFFTIMVLCISMLVYTSCYALSPESDVIYEGIDVSNWQGYIDYSNVKNEGIDIVYIKASQGSNYKDPYFELNYENAKSNGLKVGVYHYVTARSITEAEREARFFASIISGKEIDCKLAMDFEDFGSLNNSQINEISRAFLEELELLTGKETIVYSDLFNSQRTFNLSNDYSLWIAYYGNYQELENIQTDWSTWEGQQYEDDGIIDGISGYVDRNRFTKEILLENNSRLPGNDGEHEENVSERKEYVVKKGDTLWAISREYDVTIEEIARLNNIQNPNLIYSGEKLIIITNSNFNEVNGLGKTFYTVQRGDTLSELAVRFDTSVEEIVRLNNIENPNFIYVGQRIRI